MAAINRAQSALTEYQDVPALEEALCILQRSYDALGMQQLAGDTRRAMEIQRQLMPVHKHLFVEANPIPVKWAMAELGLCGPTLRLPMTPLSASFHTTVKDALRSGGLV